MNPRPPSLTAPLVEVTRDVEDEIPYQGFLVVESDHLVVLHRVSDRFDLDGYCAFRREDIRAIHVSFEKVELLRRALRIKDLQPITPMGLDATSMRSLMETAQAAFGLVVVARERIHLDEVEVGTIRMTSDDTYVLRFMNVNAEWENDDRPFRYRDVTRLEFGGEYEQTLLAVAQSYESDRES
jgi:hypothetical protein